MMRHLPLLLCALLSAVVKLLLPLLTGSLSVQEFFQHWFAASKQCQDGQLFGSVLRDSQIDCLDVSAHSSEGAATEHSQRKQPDGERGGRHGHIHRVDYSGLLCATGKNGSNTPPSYLR